VTEGYGILQPRVSVNLASAAGSLFGGCMPGTPASIPIRPRSRTPTRTCSAQGSSLARGCTTSTPSRRLSAGASRRTRCCRTISLKACTRGPRSSRRGVGRRLPRERPGARAPAARWCGATGRSSPGSSRWSRHHWFARNRLPVISRGRSSTTSGAASCARAPRLLRGRLDVPAREPTRLDGRRSHRRRVPVRRLPVPVPQAAPRVRAGSRPPSRPRGGTEYLFCASPLTLVFLPFHAWRWCTPSR